MIENKLEFTALTSTLLELAIAGSAFFIMPKATLIGFFVAYQCFVLLLIEHIFSRIILFYAEQELDL